MIFIAALLLICSLASAQQKYPMRLAPTTGYHLYDGSRNPTVRPNDAVITATNPDDTPQRPLTFYVSNVVTPIETVLRTAIPDDATAIQKELNKELRDERVQTILESASGKKVIATFTVIDVVRRSRPDLWNIPADARQHEMDLWQKYPYLVIASINWKSPVYMTPGDQAELAKAKKKYEETRKIKNYGGGDPQDLYEREKKRITKAAQDRIPSHTVFIESGDDSVLTWEKKNQKTITGWIRRIGAFKYFPYESTANRYYAVSEFVLIHTPNVAATGVSSDDGAMNIGGQPAEESTTQPASQPGTFIMK